MPTYTQQDALARDDADALRPCRQQFYLPSMGQAGRTTYLCGHSLGAQPRTVLAQLEQVLTEWQQLGVEGFFVGKEPWLELPTRIAALMAPLVGALPVEVMPMNSLTVNLHQLFTSFYRPTGRRFKIMVEHRPFSSDSYMVQSQLALHGISVQEGLLELQPRPGEVLLRDEDILATLKEQGDSLALVLLGGVNYLTGQLFDLEAITKATQANGAVMGVDLAHAAGNVPLQLHNWGVDFAAWCNYKYLNSGPGAPGAIFVHQHHAQRKELHRLAGWWGYPTAKRFEMQQHFTPAEGAAGWQVSTPTILGMAPMLTSLKIFSAVGMDALRRKSLALTAYFAELVSALPEVELLTPMEPERRGAMLTFRLKRGGKAVFDALQAQGICCDWREPDVIRATPAPLYNSYEDVWLLVNALNQALAQNPS